MRQDHTEQRRRQKQAAAEEVDTNANPVNNPSAQAAAAAAAAANPGQAIAALENAQDEAAMAEGAVVPRPVLFIDARAQLMSRPKGLYEIW